MNMDPSLKLVSDQTSADEVRGRKRRNQRIAASVVGIVVSMLVTAGLIGALQSGRVPADRPTEPPPSTERVGFVGLPPEGAQLSTPRAEGW